MKTEKENTASPVNEGELALINGYSRKKLSGNDVYVFSVNLCDNEVDRDFDCFSLSALNELAVLFEGKTGIFDHNAKSSLQTARIFKAWVETDKTKKTTLGENYSVLKARAYMIRTKENESLIEEIEGGIKKEVSVSCSLSKAVCSICGEDMRHGKCNHIRGKSYSGSLCFSVLKEATDAYEWSFVAVPAQRAAGVTKSFKKEEISTQDTLEIIKSANSPLNLSFEQVKTLKNRIAALEKGAEDSKLYRADLLSEIEKYAHIVMPTINQKAFAKGFENMNIHELKELSKGLREQAGKIFPPEPQLKPFCEKTKTDNTAFKI